MVSTIHQRAPQAGLIITSLRNRLRGERVRQLLYIARNVPVLKALKMWDGQK